MNNYWVSKDPKDSIDPLGNKINSISFTCFAEKGLEMDSIKELLQDGFLSESEVYPVCSKLVYAQGIARKRAFNEKP